MKPVQPLVRLALIINLTPKIMETTMKSFLKFTAIALASLVLTPAASASDYKEQLAELRTKFKAADKNEDGKLTQKEARDGGMSRLANFFSRVDTDGDGYVTQAQLEARLKARYE